MGQIFTSVSGKTVTIRVVIDPSDVALTGSDRWEFVISSKTDHGLGSTGAPDYPYYVDHLVSRGSATFTRILRDDKYVVELALVGQGVVDFSEFVIIAETPVPKPGVFSFCYGQTVDIHCGMNPALPVVKAGDTISIKADIVNYGPVGKVNAIFKIDNVAVFNDTIQSLESATGGAGTVFWSPVLSSYTMPNKTISVKIETYGWDTSKSTWVAGGIQNITITPSVPSCTGIDLVPFSASINVGEKVDLAVLITPGNVQFSVTLKGRQEGGTESVIGTCKTSGTGTINGGSTCSFTWDSAGKLSGGSGTYYVKAYSGNCTSTETVITVNQPIRQWNLGINVIDSSTGTVVQGATVLAATAGKASQSKVTDSSGMATFRMDEGTISIAISKDKYNTFNTAEYLFSDISRTYQLVAIPPTPTIGDVQFVSVPSGADIYVDNVVLGTQTPMTVAGIPAGPHNWTLKLVGYNDSQGNVIVQSGGLASVYVTLTEKTPTMGSLNITSHPVMEAEVWIDGVNTRLTTSGLTIITDIPPGQHTYKLVLSGYKDVTGKFNVVAGQTTTLDVEMIALETIGTLEMTSEPSGARIWIDDVDTGRNTPATIVNLVKGDHKYKTVLSGYKDINGTVSIIAGGTKIVHLILEKGEKGLGLEVWAGVAIASVAILSFLKSSSEKK